MAGIILILLIVVLLIVIAMSKNKKKTSLVALGILVSYHLYVSYKYGPNKKDVSVMKPMAEAISNYIVKNGIPKSLKEISGLPYRIYQKENKAFYYFAVRGVVYQIFDSGFTKVIEAMHKRGNGYTAVWITFKKDKNNKYISKPLEFVLIHRNGICSSMKQ